MYTNCINYVQSFALCDINFIKWQIIIHFRLIKIELVINSVKCLRNASQITPILSILLELLQQFNCFFFLLTSWYVLILILFPFRSNGFYCIPSIVLDFRFTTKSSLLIHLPYLWNFLASQVLYGIYSLEIRLKMSMQ